MIVVADTTPFSELAKIGQMNLLSDVFGQIIIPQEVYNEITSGKHPAAIALPLASWVEVRSVTDSQKVANLQTATNLDLGESAAIILAEELGADYLLKYLRALNWRFSISEALGYTHPTDRSIA